MVGMILLILVSACLAAFMVNRLYVGFSQGELNVKGIVYHRNDTPIAYWLTMTMAAFGLLFGLGITIVGLIGLFAP